MSTVETSETQAKTELKSAPLNWSCWSLPLKMHLDDVAVSRSRDVTTREAPQPTNAARAGTCTAAIPKMTPGPRGSGEMRRQGRLRQGRQAPQAPRRRAPWRTPGSCAPRRTPRARASGGCGTRGTSRTPCSARCAAGAAARSTGTCPQARARRRSGRCCQRRRQDRRRHSRHRRRRHHRHTRPRRRGHRRSRRRRDRARGIGAVAAVTRKTRADAEVLGLFAHELLTRNFYKALSILRSIFYFPK